MNISIVCICTACMPSARGHRKKAADTLKLELSMVVNRNEDTGTQSPVLCRTNNKS